MSAPTDLAAASTAGQDRTVRVLRAGEDPACTRTLNAAHDLDRGIVVVHANPAATRAGLAEDLLCALGKQPAAVAAIDGTARRGWDLATLWVRADRVGHLIVLDADRLAHGELAALAGLPGSALSLVTRYGLAADQRAALPPPAGRLAERWQTLQPDLPGPPAVPAFPAVPDSDFLNFRSHAARLLEPGAFRRVDEVYRTSFHTARTQVRTCWREPPPWQRGHAAADWDRALVQAAVQRLTVDATSPGELRTLRHAVTAGFFREGLLVDLAPDSYADRLAASTPRSAPALMARLRSLRGPQPAGALAVALATGMNPDELHRLRRSDLTETSDGDLSLRVNGAVLRLPGAHAAAVRAALADGETADPSVGLFTGNRARVEATARQAAARAGTELLAPIRCQAVTDLRRSWP